MSNVSETADINIDEFVKMRTDWELKHKSYNKMLKKMGLPPKNPNTIYIFIDNETTTKINSKS